MGLGDELMAAGQAMRLHLEDPSHRKVLICDVNRQPRWHELWDGNPAIAHPREVTPRTPVIRVLNGPRCRPYIRYPFTASSGITFTSYQARQQPPVLFLTEEEQQLGRDLRQKIGPYVVVEPDVKVSSSQNKSWGRDRFEAVVRAFPDVRFVRLEEPRAKTFLPAPRIKTATFRAACGYLSAADGYLGPEGAGHHAAAALGRPAVVIFGGFISPKTTGYPQHTNLADSGPKSPCGKWNACAHCREAMSKIRAWQVIEAVREMVNAAPMEKAG